MSGNARADLFRETSTQVGARYDLAVPGTLRLVPPEGRLSELQRACEATKVMVFGKPPDIDEIMSTLEQLEVEINGLV